MAVNKPVIALFDGEVLRPEQPLDLPPNTRVRLTIESDRKNPEDWGLFIRTARRQKLDGPSDWSARFEEYLYGDKV